MTTIARVRFWLLWDLINTLTLGLGFGLASWWYVHSGHPNPSVGLLLLPIDQPRGIILIDLALCLMQLPFLRQFQWSRLSIRWVFTAWILSSFYRLWMISYIRSITFFFFALTNPDTEITTKGDYVIGAITGAVAGLSGGGLTGLIQSFIIPVRKCWFAISAVAWAAAWAIGWIVMRYVSLALYYGTVFLPAWADMSDAEQRIAYGKLMEPKGFTLNLYYELAIYGAVIGLVAGTVTGIGLLVCFPRGNRSL